MWRVNRGYVRIVTNPKQACKLLIGRRGKSLKMQTEKKLGKSHAKENYLLGKRVDRQIDYIRLDRQGLRDVGVEQKATQRRR